MAFFSDHDCILSGRRRSCRITEEFSACTAGPVLDVSIFCAGRFLRFNMIDRMTLCRSYYLSQGDRRRSCRVAKVFIAHTASPVFRVPFLCAGRFLCSNMSDRMAFSRNYGLFSADRCFPCSIAKDFPAVLAGPVFSIPSLCTGSFCRRGSVQTVTFCRDLHSCRLIACAAYHTMVRLGTICCTCSLYVNSIGLTPLMPCSSNIFCNLFSADRADLFTTSFFGTGCFLCNFPLTEFVLTGVTRYTGLS